MSETPPNDKPAKDFNKIDLAQLQSFSFGTQWSQDKADPSGNSGGAREPRRDDRPRREGPGAGAPRDRRGFRKPAGPGEAGGTAPATGGESGSPAPREQRREGGFDSRGPRRDGPGGAPGQGEFRGGQGGPRREGGPRFGGPREGGFAPRDQGPYVSPFFNVTFYPEDSGFSALAKAIRASCRTYELFEIARVIIGKNDRFIAVVQHKTSDGAPSAAPAVKPAPFAISVPDGIPFDTEEAAINHVLEKHAGQFFESAEVEIEAPKGNFQVVNRCTVTGELLGPPNYHRYNQIVQQHHAANIKLPFEVYRNKIESVREPEVIAQWLEKMKKTTRYTWKLNPPAAAPTPAPEAAPAAVEGDSAPESAPVETPAAPEAAPAVSFDSFEEARQYLLTTARDKVVRTVESVRFSGKNLETLPPGELRRTIEGALERQRRFPLDTANALRGRLRREGFTIFKKGSKGISYVCAVKRKFRIPNQTFSDSIGALISFIETHPMIKASELADKFLGFPAPAAPAKAAAPVEGETAAESAAPAAPALTAEQTAKLNRLNGDLRWLVSEGYVTEFIDGRLFAPAPVVESRKKEIEGAEHDPENFPEVPAEAAKAVATEEAKSEEPAS